MVAYVLAVETRLRLTIRTMTAEIYLIRGTMGVYLTGRLCVYVQKKRKRFDVRKTDVQKGLESKPSLHVPD